MGRPTTGRTKRVTTISIDPEVWKNFQEVVEAKQPDGDTSASSHAETMIKKEIARLTGKDVPDTVDKAALHRKLITLNKRRSDLTNAFRKRDDGARAMAKLDVLRDRYNLDAEFANASEFIRQILQDKDEEGTLAHDTFSSRPATDLPLFIAMVEVNVDITETNKKLLEAIKQRYL